MKIRKYSVIETHEEFHLKMDNGKEKMPYLSMKYLSEFTDTFSLSKIEAKLDPEYRSRLWYVASGYVYYSAGHKLKQNKHPNLSLA